MTTAADPLRSALRLAGHRWSVWPVGIAVVVLASAGGARGLDAVASAAGPTIAWGLVSMACRFLAGRLPARSIVPTEKALPVPQLALIVAPQCPAEACPDVLQMVERLPEHLRRLVTAEEGSVRSASLSGER